MDRRDFFVSTAFALGATSFFTKPKFKVSLAEWSFHRAIRSGAMDHLDLPRVARRDFDLRAVEYVNTFFKDKAGDRAYLREMNRRADDAGVYQHLIMIDAEGSLGDPDLSKRDLAVSNHKRWMDAAKELGCATIRVNAESEGTPEQQMERVAEGWHRLCEYGDDVDINVIVENHEGISCNAAWLAALTRKVNHRRCGTLPDFGNFDLGNGKRYDAYRGVAELMPYAKAVSVKSHDFDAAGNETTKDYRRLMTIVRAAGYRGWLGVEYEGDRLGEKEGVAATLRLLKTVENEID